MTLLLLTIKIISSYAPNAVYGFSLQTLLHLAKQSGSQAKTGFNKLSAWLKSTQQKYIEVLSTMDDGS